jgi:hypothetical protein
MEAEPAQPCAVKTGQEVVVGQVALVDHRTHFGRKNKIVRNTRLSPQKRLQHSLVPQF